MKPVDKPLTATQKIAAFLLSLEKATAASLLDKLDQKLLADVASAMGELDPRLTVVESVDALYQEVARRLNAVEGPRSQKDPELAAFLEAGLGKERAKQVLAQIHERRRHERPFAAIEKHPTALVSRVLSEESEAVAALVLAHVEPRISAEILSGFQPDRALDIVRRISKIIPPGFEALATVAENLDKRVRAVASLPVPGDPAVRLKSIAQMLTFTEKDLEKAVLGGLESDSKETVEKIRDLMFTWDDLADVDKRGMQKILGAIETKTLSVALKACAPDVEANILGNLSVRVRAMVADERELAGPMPMAEVLLARGEIMKAVRGLLESGEFAPARAGEELVK